MDNNNNNLNSIPDIEEISAPAVADSAETAKTDEFIKENIKGMDNITPAEGLSASTASNIENSSPAMEIPTQPQNIYEMPKSSHKGLKIGITLVASLLVVLLVASPFLKPLLSSMTSTIRNDARKTITIAGGDMPTNTFDTIGDDPSPVIDGFKEAEGTPDVDAPTKTSEEYAGVAGGDLAGEIADVPEEVSPATEHLISGPEAPVGDDTVIIDDPVIDDPDTILPGDPSQDDNPRAGVLTAGEWNDNNNWDFFTKVIRSNADFVAYQKSFSIYPTERVEVKVTSGGKPVVNATVTGLDGGNNLIWAAVTDNNGVAYLFPNMFTDKSQDSIVNINVVSGNATTTVKNTGKTVEVSLDSAQEVKKALDLMFVIDTTGSMSDELYYLQWELKDIIEKVKSQNENIPIRLSINFYRDHTDAYVVKANPFTTDIDDAVAKISDEDAAGGGDYPEAVDEAIEDAINKHEWDATSYARLMFLVLDAPPHEESEIVERINTTIQKAAEKGVRIISVAASGIDKRTEMMLRSFAVATGGTYTFLTDDSGIGGGHIEPTIGDYEVRPFNQVIIDVINSYLK